ncbi:HD domain-containing protein [Paenibacillus polygoni]|uniref:HD domain-containing protein n=1 Tax=Paenibacillus polygoni TaxID=3050112 RepID=A0ABY8WX70_9BACL|nr:HD domain-containing protein [Paenibacillus polygoni]WIV17640.1 HD domain-containing protein [Paenibacillus polygoni]
MNQKVLTQQEEALLEAAEAYVKKELSGEGTGHDYWHIYRVVQTAEKIAIAEGANLYICKLAAYLHDIADEKLNPSKEAGMAKVDTWLKEHHVSDEDRSHVLEIIGNMSYNGGHNPPMSTLEGKVVQDADRLDAIGAISVARAFVYAGSKGHLIYDPDIKPREDMTQEQYRTGKNTAINHFYEKLLKLKDLMNTKHGIELAEKRHEFMEQYLDQFFKEWEGNV